MSQSKVSKVVLRNRSGAEGKLSTGANVVVELDGKPVPGAHFIKIEAKSKGICKVVIELFAEVEAEVYAELEEGPKHKSGLSTVGGKHLAQYDLSSYTPKRIVTQD